MIVVACDRIKGPMRSLGRLLQTQPNISQGIFIVSLLDEQSFVLGHSGCCEGILSLLHAEEGLLHTTTILPYAEIYSRSKDAWIWNK